MSNLSRGLHPGLYWNVAITISICLWLALTPALAQRPPFAELEGRADKAMAAGDLDQAILLYEKLANFYPDSAVAHNKLGVAHYKKGNDPRAIYSFRQALALSRNDAQALHNLVLASGRQADNLSREARFSEAARNLDELISNYSWHPQYSVLLYYRGRLEFLRGQIDDGLAWWKKAAALAPDSGVARVMAAQSRPFDDKTVALYNEALTKVKTEPAFDLLLGMRYVEQGKFDDAATNFTAGLEKIRLANIPFPILSLKGAQAFLALGDTAAAIRLLEEARLQRPDWASLRTLLWACYLAAGNQPQAEQTLQDAFELDGKPKLALLGASTSPVRLTTSGGSLRLMPVNAVSPSLGKATLSLDGQSLETEIKPGDALVFRVSQGRLSLESQATLSRPGGREGTLAPPLVAKDRKGALYRLADALLKRPVVIVFWSASGPDPLTLLQGLGGLKAHYGDRLETVAIHTDPGAQKEALRLYLSQPSTSAQLWGDARICQEFGVPGAPAVVVIDRAGRIVMRELSPGEGLFQELPFWLEDLP
jgi:tetratricopeptide (TPR) repeat protein